MISIRVIKEERAQDINLPNEPFSLFGRMIPSYVNECWGYDTVYWEEEKITEMCFPQENYNYAEMKENSVFLGAYDEDKCVGLAILQQGFFKYMYLYDLKVNADVRGKGIGKLLIEEAKRVALAQGYRGLYTQGQDNNLGACLFYIKSGFYIGGFDSNVYKGTKQEGKADILFYLDC